MMKHNDTTHKMTCRNDNDEVSLYQRSDNQDREDDQHHLLQVSVKERSANNK